MCPYAFQTSWWIREVRDLAGVDVRWRFFSLEEINRVEGKKHPWERPWSYGWSMMRIGALLRRDDPALLDAWYAKAGTALHVEGRKPHDPDVARELLAELGVDPSVVDDAIADPTTSDEVKAAAWKFIDFSHSDDNLRSWNQATFTVPSLQALNNDPALLEAAPGLATSFAALPTGQWIGQIGDRDRFFASIYNAYISVDIGEASAEDALATAEQEINAMIDENLGP